MKIRNGFVSNSSSSSFIIVGKDTEFPFETIELDMMYKCVIKRYGIPIDVNDHVYLSRLISDGSDWDFDYKPNYDYSSDNDKSYKIFEYIEYDRDIEISPGFFIKLQCDSKTETELNISLLLDKGM